MQSTRVLIVSGNVTLDKKKVVRGTLLQKGVLDTSDKSFIKLRVENWNSIVVVGPSSSLRIDSTGGKFTVHLNYGVARVKPLKNYKDVEHPYLFTTSNALVKSSKSDYILQQNFLFNDTEAVVNTGTVSFTPRYNKTVSKIIQKGQWVGLGGRFNDLIPKIKKLSRTAAEYYTELLLL